MIDIFFLSYDEDFADVNFDLLKLVAPNAKRVHGISGIFEAHQECARRSKTSHFYVVDADAVIEEDFTFKFTPNPTRDAYPGVPETECVYVWRSRNPINDLVYGYGGVKLFPRQRLLDVSEWTVDMTTSIGAPLVPKFQISNITAFNTDPFNTWKSAFRECAKLASAIIPNSDNIDNENRLQVWCEQGADRPFGKYCIQGANQGREFGTFYKNNANALKKINDFEWLRKVFNERQS